MFAVGRISTTVEKGSIKVAVHYEDMLYTTIKLWNARHLFGKYWHGLSK